MSISKKAGLGAFATLLLVSFLAIVFAFVPSDKSEAKTARRSTIYYYNAASTTFASMKTAGNWGTSQNSAYQCGGDLEVPCSIAVPDGVSLQDHLNSFSTQNSLISAAGRRESAD